MSAVKECYEVTGSRVDWARRIVGKEQWLLTKEIDVAIPIYHWSRVFEYPWIMMCGHFKAGQWVLDAGGGDSPLQSFIAKQAAQVINIDLDPFYQREQAAERKYVVLVKGDIRELPFLDNVLQRVVCVSVLEHMEGPLRAVQELWRVLAPGGRLLITMDIANYARYNHTIDQSLAEGILALFGLKLPQQPQDILQMTFPAIDMKPGDPEEVSSHVLCFYCDKPLSDR